MTLKNVADGQSPLKCFFHRYSLRNVRKSCSHSWEVMTLVLGFNVDIANQFFGSIWKTRKISLIVFGSLCLVQVHAELDQLRKGLFETLQFELLTISQVLLRQRTLK